MAEEQEDGPESGGSGAPSPSAAGSSAGTRPTGAAEDYLKAIYKLQPPTGSVSTSDLASELDRSAASVTNMVKSLARKGKLEHVPYHGVRLTREGEQSALRIIRRHRVIELYLIEKLGYTWDNVHAEAERLEHAVSDELVDRMAAALGDPQVDPHGAPIPSREGEIEETRAVALDEVEGEARAVIRQVVDEDPDRLRHLARLGLFPGTEVRVRPRTSRHGPIRIRVGEEEHALDRRLAASIMVEER